MVSDFAVGFKQGQEHGKQIMQERIYDAMLEIMKYEHEGFINISLARLDEILKKCGVEDGNVD